MTRADGTDQPATIVTERLSLRRVEIGDRPLLIELERDPEVMRYLNGGQPTPEAGGDTPGGFRMPRGAETDLWVAFERATGAFVGWFSLRLGPDPTVRELGYRLRRVHWGRGYASEGARALLAFGFRDLGLARVWAETMAVNLGSRRVLEKLGLRLVRTYLLDTAAPIPGAQAGEVVYEIERADWAAATNPGYAAESRDFPR